MTDKVKLVWISHLKDKDEKERFKKSVLSQQDVWERLEEILADRLENLGPDIRDYENPSWAYRQAHINGYKEAIFELLELLPLTEG